MNYTSSIQAAGDYAAKGWSVFACSPGSKVPPKGSKGFHDATTDGAIIATMFADPTANIAIATGEKSAVAVIDIDLYAGGSLDGLTAELGPLPETLTARTRAGGQHLFFAYPTGVPLGSHNGVIAAHVDLKADGGYVVAAPSWVNADDKGGAGRYEWINDAPVAEMPETWVNRWTSLKNKAERTHDAQSSATNEFGPTRYALPDRIPKGRRNSDLLAYAAHLRAKGMPESLILEAARDCNRARCDVPVDDAELMDVVSRYAKEDISNPSDWPDPKPVEAALPPVKAFDPAILPNRFRPFVEDQAELMQVAPDFIAAPLMVAAAAALGNGFAIAPKAIDSSWLVSPVLWGGVVARPGMLKTPAIDKATRHLNAIESELLVTFEQKRVQYLMDKISFEGAKKKAIAAAAAGKTATLPVEPEEPKPERILVNDSTAQMLGEILRHSPRGVLVLRDELTSLLESLAADGQEGARGFYLEGWNGQGSYRVDRIGRGSFIIPRMALWVFGGIQPGRLQAYIRQAVSGGNGDDGLIQRFQLLVWPDTVKAWENVDRSPNFDAAQTVEDTFLHLRNLDPVAIGASVDPFGKRPAYFNFTTEAQLVFDQFRGKLEPSARAEGKHEALESHLSKYRSLVPALALVIHLADGGTGPVGRDPLRKAILWSDYLWSHAKRIYASVTNAQAFGAKSLADRISGSKLTSPFTVRDVQRHGWQHLGNVEDVRNAVNWLIDAGWLRVVKGTSGDSGGRASDTYFINPKVQQK